MKRWVWIVAIFAGLAGPVFAGSRSLFFGGAVSSGAMTTVIVTTTPLLILSTGTNVPMGWSSIAGGGLIFGSPKSTTTYGEYLPDRVNLEIYNDSTADIWMGFSQSVSTQPGKNYGRRIPANGGSWSSDTQIASYWLVSNTTTLRNVVITQQR